MAGRQLREDLPDPKGGRLRAGTRPHAASPRRSGFSTWGPPSPLKHPGVGLNTYSALQLRSKNLDFALSVEQTSLSTEVTEVTEPMYGKSKRVGLVSRYFFRFAAQLPQLLHSRSAPRLFTTYVQFESNPMSASTRPCPLLVDAPVEVVLDTHVELLVTQRLHVSG